MSKEQSFQAVEVTFTNPETNESFTGFCVCESMSPSQFQEMFQSDATVSEVLSDMKVTPPMKIEDLAAYPEFESLMEALGKAVDGR